MESKKKYGLIGRRLDYSFSKNYFTRKFEQENIAAEYENVEITDLKSLRQVIADKNILGFNVTIPFKEKIIKYLDALSPTAEKIEAVNCVEIAPNDYWIGHNTDCIGFEKSLLDLIGNQRPKALIFGSGGASQAVQFVLKKNEIDFTLVSRHEYEGFIQYEDLNKEILAQYRLLINTTPLGTYPNVNECVDIPYNDITSKHFCFDLVYNPEKSEFLTRAQDRGAKIMNGKEMLEIQAEESWKIWQAIK